MPDRGSTQASPDMSLKRPTRGRGLEVKKKNRQHSACAQLICLENNGHHVKNPHMQKPSHGQLSRKCHALSKKRSSALEGRCLGSSDGEQSLTKERSESCVTDDRAAVRTKPEVSNNAPNNDSASSSSAPSNQDTKIATLQSEYADLSISSDCIRKDSQAVDPSLPTELVHDILGRVNWRDVMQLRGQLSKVFKDLIHHPAFRRSRPKAEAEFSPSFFTTDAAGDLHWRGFDTKLRIWKSLPSLNFAKNTVLPSPDPDLFKDYLVAGDGGLLCINVGKSTGREELVVCNPLTQQVKLLPPLKHPRHPVLMHLKVDDDSGHYKIVVAGSAAIGTEDLSLKTEEYDSRTGEWECPEKSDMPCPAFGLNEYQNGVYFTDSDRELLLCVAIIDTRGRGVLAYDLQKHKWLEGLTNFHIPLVRNELNVGYLATTQIVECGGAVYVFTEQECGKEVYFLIHKLNLDGYDDKPWDEILRRKRTGGRGLLVYPEFMCVPVSEYELCIFNSVEHTIEIIDLNKPTEVRPPLPAPSSKANRFHSLNPISFVVRPSFVSVVCPRGRNPGSRCDLKQQFCSECQRRLCLQSPSSHMHDDSEMIDHPAAETDEAAARKNEAEVRPNGPARSDIGSTKNKCDLRWRDLKRPESTNKVTAPRSVRISS